MRVWAEKDQVWAAFMKASIRLIEVGGKPFYAHALHPVTNKYHFIGEKNCVENQAI